MRRVRSLPMLLLFIFGLVALAVGSMSSAYADDPDGAFQASDSGTVIDVGPSSMLAPVELILDDGTSENGIGLTAGGEFLWFNRFTPNPADFPFTLNTVDVLFGSDSLCSVGDAVDVYVWTDADSNPNNGATYEGGASGTIEVLDAFSSYDVNLMLDGPGDVLIGVVNRGCDLAGQFPASIDQTASQGRSWITLYSGPVADPPVLPAPTQGVIDDFGFPGNWMIRGYGETGAATAVTLDNMSSEGTGFPLAAVALAALGLTVGVMAIRRRVNG